MTDSQEDRFFQRLFEQISLTDEDLSAGEDLLPGSTLPFPDFPGYTPIRVLGRGGFGTVYLVRDDRLERNVAIKILRIGPSTSDRERFIAEARMLASVRHPNVLAIYSVTEGEGYAGLATEYVQGESLLEILERQGPFGQQEAAQIGVAMCRALAAVHAQGIIHRDVKTSNILREEGGRLVLSDFGLGAFLATDLKTDKETRLEGSPFFMSPEQARGEQLSVHTDIYSLGVVLYHLVSGKLPCRATDLRDLLAAIARGALQPLRDVRPDLSDDFVAVVRKAMDLDPAKRHRSAGELEEALLATLKTAHPTADRLTPSWRLPAGAGAVAAVIVLLLAAALAASFWRGKTILAPPLASATFFASGAGANRALANGARIAAGDQVHVEFQGQTDLHVYVLNEDDAGSRHLLFPLRGGALGNPLPGGRPHRLPGRMEGIDVDWVVSGKGESEWICIVAAVEPIAALAELLKGNLPADAPPGVSYPLLDEETVRRTTRSLDRLAPSRVSPPSSPGERAEPRGLREWIEILTASLSSQDPPKMWVHTVILKKA